MNITGSLKDSITCLSDLLDVRHKVYPISEDCLTLMAETVTGEIIEGEEEITEKENKFPMDFDEEDFREEESKDDTLDNSTT